MSGFEIPACNNCTSAYSGPCIQCAQANSDYIAKVCYNCYITKSHHCAYCGVSFVASMLNQKAKACVVHKPEYGGKCFKCNGNL